MNWVKRLQRTFYATGWSQAELSRRADVPYDSVTKYLLGRVERPRGDTLERLAKALDVDPLWLEKGISAEGNIETTVPVMGFVGAGAEIEPEFEQVPPDGLYDVQLPIPVPAEMIAFEVRGISMLPRYDEGDVIVVWKEQRRATDSFLGEEAAVRTRDGRRFLKTIRRGADGYYNLDSWNAHPIEGVELEWIGEIYVTIRASQLRRSVMSLTKWAEKKSA